MSFIEAEIACQPDCWRVAAELARRGGLGLPEPGERIAVVGCGTSRFIAQAYAARREAAGQGWSDAFAASEFRHRDHDAVVVLSRSGTTTEVVELLDRLPAGRTVTLTADGESPVARRATHPVVLAFAAERSVVQTRFATTSLALLTAGLGEDLTPVITDAERALAAPLPVTPGGHRPRDPAARRDVRATARPPGASGGRGHVVFLGRGWSAGLANEAALKCQEAAGVWTESHSAMEYRHGPISAVGEDSLVWSLDAVPRGLDHEVAALGGRLVRSELDPLAELVRVQRFAVALARSAGRDPDRPRGLSFSVVLGPSGAVQPAPPVEPGQSGEPTQSGEPSHEGGNT